MEIAEDQGRKRKGSDDEWESIDEEDFLVQEGSPSTKDMEKWIQAGLSSLQNARRNNSFQHQQCVQYKECDDKERSLVTYKRLIQMFIVL